VLFAGDELPSGAALTVWIVWGMTDNIPNATRLRI
jgi:hypothetical protein